MSETTTKPPAEPAKTETRPSAGASAIPRRGGAGARLRTEHGTTQIADTVVAKIAALATREISGVQAMGKGMARTFGAIRSRVPGAAPDTSTQGIAVEVGEAQCAIDIDIVVYYGQSVIEVTEAVRENVLNRLETMTALQVVEVNIFVDDLYIDSEPDAQQPARVN